MKPFRFLALVLMFFLDVHVKAQTCTSPDCAEAAGRHPRMVHKPEAVLDAGALAEPRGPGKLHLVRGLFYLAGPGEFSTPFATFRCEGGCEALVERQADRVIFKNLQGDWRAERKGDQQEYALPVAMQVRVSEVTHEGRADMEFPQSLPWLNTIKTWARLYNGTPEAFKEEAARFREAWKDAVEAASLLHQESASREIASHEKELAQERARRLAREREDAELRRQFRERNYLSP